MTESLFLDHHAALYAPELNFGSGLYAKRPVALVRGQGAYLWDQDGNRYIDCAAGHGVANLGHAHPGVAQAITDQAERLVTCPETFFNDRRAEYMAALLDLAPGLERVFFCNSGTEAVEAAIKLARFSTQKTKVVACMRGFHGRTFGALSATWDRKVRDPFQPLVPDFHHIPYNSLEELDRVVDEDSACLILEVVQGEGGVRLATPEFLLAAQQICRERGVLLVVDEVQTGFGRTGVMFAYQHHDLKPDLVCLAKSMAGGLPAGAVMMGPRLRPLSPGLHGSTFGGNPLVCAAGLAVIAGLKSAKLPDKAAEHGTWLLETLSEMSTPVIREVRGLGLMVGIELRSKAAPFLQALLARGVIALPAGMTVIRLLPPLVISRQQLVTVVEAIAAVLSEPEREQT